MSKKEEYQQQENDQVIIIKNNEKKTKFAPGTGYGSTTLTWHNGKIVQIDHTETER